MTEFPVVLVINCGSSSIKFFRPGRASCDCLLNGVAEGINAERASLSLNGGEPVATGAARLRRRPCRRSPEH
ncbi:propionate kinase [Klebsiella pneumoniae]|uniref:Propionate kinase n=1 Tax=Klebsiella pneumoniae TaxID=573 RepID=A0A447S6U7_KLEPN|nr:propionate kinase [Klebsiella pneumoniae]